MRAFSFFSRSFLNELTKLKNAYLVLMMVAMAIFVPAIYFLHYLIDFERVILAEGINPWRKFFFSQFSMTPTLFSFFVIIVTSYLTQMEHKSNAMKMTFAMPVPKWAIYFSKMAIILVVVGITYSLFLVLILGNGYVLSVINPEYAFAKYSPDMLQMLKVFVSSFITVFGIVALQYWLSFRIKNFLIPMGFGIIMVIIGIIIFRSARFAPYFLYGYNISNLTTIIPSNPDTYQWLSKFSLLSLVTFLLVSVLGYINISKTSIK